MEEVCSYLRRSLSVVEMVKLLQLVHLRTLQETLSAFLG